MLRILFKCGDYYYLTVAEVGTAGPATGHMVISARSKSPFGSWENSPFNPIIRAQSSSEKWGGSVVHATIFKDANKKWWIIFHGYEKDYYNMGRQSLLAPVEWTDDGWFKLPDNVEIDKPIKRPSKPIVGEVFSLNDNFEGNTLKPQWKFFGEYNTDRFQLTDDSLVINAKGNSVAESSPLLCMPSDHSYMAQVELEIEGNAIGGLVLFYSHKAYSGIFSDSKNILTNLRGWQFQTETDVIKNHVYLRLKNINNAVDMYYSLDGKNWNKIESSLEVSAFHHNVLSDFLSLRIGLVSMGEDSIRFKNFEYEPIN